MLMPQETSTNVDIFGLLSGSDEKEKKKKQRQDLLASTGVKEFFPEGKISINKYTCFGQECRLCIKACPTGALYWKAGQVGITEELCVYCNACVLTCMVDNCIKVERRRQDGKTEKFSKTKDVLNLESSINTKKRVERVRVVLPSVTDYCKRYWKE
ncbi:MAG: hypothetical protein ACM3WQ_04030 [Chloroflexota bacterium]